VSALRVLLVAEEAAGIQVLRRLAGSSHEIAGVLTAPPTRGGGATVASVAEGLGLAVEPSERVRDPALAAWIRDRNVDLLLNVHSLFVIHADAVEAPRIGSFNLHPGPLPAYAGLNAPSWAIYHGEERHAVTVHWMEPGIDTGAIAYEASFPIAETDTGLSLSLRCVREGLPLLERLLEDAERGAIPARAQDRSHRRYFGREAPQEGRVEWSRTAREVVDFVRASDYFPFASPWGSPLATLGDREIEILKAARTERATSGPPGAVGAAEDGAVAVACADEWVAVQRVAVEGRPEDAAAVLRPGTRFVERSLSRR
jgi:UDP-4-amino-4-deoxy-L-arabinose formyltransferase/UDP-glucuronic acid dehydrogenase (UDP-4-keto-hexauronic acid decarboxylating)